MFKILKGNKRFGNKTFPSYNDARKYVAAKLGTTLHNLRLRTAGFSIQHI